MLQHKRPRLHPRQDGESRADLLKSLPQSKEPAVRTRALKAPNGSDPQDVRSCLKQRARRGALALLCYFLHKSWRRHYHFLWRGWKFYFFPLIENQLLLVLLFRWGTSRKRGCGAFFTGGLPQSSLFPPSLPIVEECLAFLSICLAHLLVEREVF